MQDQGPTSQSWILKHYTAPPSKKPQQIQHFAANKEQNCPLFYCPPEQKPVLTATERHAKMHTQNCLLFAVSVCCVCVCVCGAGGTIVVGLTGGVVGGGRQARQAWSRLVPVLSPLSPLCNNPSVTAAPETQPACVVRLSFSRKRKRARSLFGPLRELCGGPGQAIIRICPVISCHERATHATLSAVSLQNNDDLPDLLTHWDASVEMVLIHSDFWTLSIETCFGGRNIPQHF